VSGSGRGRLGSRTGGTARTLVCSIFKLVCAPRPPSPPSSTMAEPSSLSSPSFSSVPFPRSSSQRIRRPSPFIVTDYASSTLHRFYTEPTAVPRHAFDLNPADFDFVDGGLTAVPHSMTVTRPSSPTPTMDFSIISPPSPEPEYDRGPYQRSRHHRFHTIHGMPSSPSPRSVRSILPRLWDALSSPARKNRTKSALGMSFEYGPHLSYADLPPLDGEEGELIDDEACFMGRDGASTTDGIGTEYELLVLRLC
jgi:F-box and WD-40 domain protein 1/11